MLNNPYVYMKYVPFVSTISRQCNHSPSWAEHKNKARHFLYRKGLGKLDERQVAAMKTVREQVSRAITNRLSQSFIWATKQIT